MDFSVRPQTVSRAVLLYLPGSSHAPGCRDQVPATLLPLVSEGAAALREKAAPPRPSPAARGNQGLAPGSVLPESAPGCPGQSPEGRPSRAPFPVRSEARCWGRFAAGHPAKPLHARPGVCPSRPRRAHPSPGQRAGSDAPLATHRRLPHRPAAWTSSRDRKVFRPPPGLPSPHGRDVGLAGETRGGDSQGDRAQAKRRPRWVRPAGGPVDAATRLCCAASHEGHPLAAQPLPRAGHSSHDAALRGLCSQRSQQGLGSLRGRS